ncbi:MAG: hypothetical protein R2708_18985 [Vicinamibacterales bacterium]
MTRLFTRGGAAAAVVSLCAAVACAPPAEPYDVVVTNARIVDGTGGPSRTGTVAIRDGHIAAVVDASAPARRVEGGTRHREGPEVVAPASSTCTRTRTCRS